MVKGNPKSSATSATRKKHAKKNAAPQDEPPPKEKKPKGKVERGKKKEPRVKMYISPVKPAPVQPDPLETTGLAHALPADLLVVLRNISKKAQVTKIRALEELQMNWVDRCLKEGEGSGLVYTLVEMLPVWLHHVSALFVHPSRRVRLVAASLHSSFLELPATRDQIIFFLRESASPTQVESILGTWSLAANDVDRSVSTIASKTWKETILTSSTEDSSSSKHLLLDENLRSSLNSFVQRATLDPSGVYLHLNPPAPPPPLVPAHVANRSAKSSAASTPRRDDGDQTPRSKVDEQEESEQDRKARLRIAALGAARSILEATTTLPEDLRDFFSDPVLWSSLQSAEACPWIDVESFGFAQPNVRKAAWTLLQSLLALHKGYKDHLSLILGIAILRSAWVETDTIVQSAMWQPLLMFLKQSPESWNLEAKKIPQDDEEDSGSEADEDRTDSPSTGLYQAYQEFLQFLQLGCSGSPIQGYPTVVVVVSTIPPSLLFSTSSPPLEQFFASFWAAIDARALSSLHRIAASAAFLGSLLECMVFLVRRLRNNDEPAHAKAAETVVREQIARVWEELSSKRLKMEERAAARMLAQTLESLFGVEEALFREAWETLERVIQESSVKEADSGLVASCLKVLVDRFKEGSVLKEKARELVKEVLSADVERCEKVLGSEGKEDGEEGAAKPNFALIVDMLEQFRQGLFDHEAFSNKLDSLLSQHSYRLLTLSPPLLLSYLVHRKDESKALAVWHSLLSSAAGSAANSQAPDQKAMNSLLGAVHQGRLPKYLKPQGGELDGLVGGFLEEALGGPMGSDQLLLVKQFMAFSDYFLSESAVYTFLQITIATFTSNVGQVIDGEEVQMTTFDVTVYLIQAVFANILKDDELTKTLLPDIFFFAYLLPVCAAGDYVDIEVTPTQSSAKGLWEAWLKAASEEQKVAISEDIKARSKGFAESTSVHPLPEDILHVLAQKIPGLQSDILSDIFPSSAQLDAMLDVLSADAIDPSIAVFDELIPTTTSRSVRKLRTPTSTDRQGFSAYARIVNGLLHAFVEDRQLARRNLWALRHFLVLEVYAKDLLNVPSAQSRSPAFDGKVSTASLRDVVHRVRQIAVYLLNLNSNTTESDKDGEGWRKAVVDWLSKERKDVDVLSQRQRFLIDLIGYARKEDGVRDTRVLKAVLEPLFKDGLEVEEAEAWMVFARKIERAAPQTSMSLISAITYTGTEPPKLDRYRNELAASLLGIKPAKANTDGLFTLRKLAASAPDPEGDVAFLPTARAVNVVKACQAWVLESGEDEDEMDEEVESAMLSVFVHLAPILQNVPGGHWPFVFDVLEGVLDRAKGEDEEEEGTDSDSEEKEEKEDGATLVALARALRLVIVLEDLAKRNKALMEEWKERRMGVLTTIRDLGVLGNDSGKSLSAPRSACRELVLSIVQHLPESLIDQNTLPKMCHLIEDPSPKVQKMAYELLRTAARKRTEYFVIEAGVDTESVVKPTLPEELLEIVQREVNFGFVGQGAGEGEGARKGQGGEGEGMEEQGENVFGYLLGWMLVFDLFQDASFKVKSSYIEQLRNLDVIVGHFIPAFLSILRLDHGQGGGLIKAFKLEPWGVDRFYIELYNPGSPHALRVLTAHVYYRALLTVPSLVHAWVLDTKDRQLTGALTAYTAAHFSPVLIRAELEHVRLHSSCSASMSTATATASGVEVLTDENMKVKVLLQVNEVSASYAVDEHLLEIRIKIPSDWPLHRVEVKEVKRVGVDENRWRAWVLGVQQIIWANNGRIVDGLSLFKKNVTLHFEGQVECAICYSIISVMDGSLPKKPCKTCKNRFHAGCLYKWFNTSHSSSCPLCRSDII
ncbi:unnamed protein product [Cyclocybe aegerita]|uniref:E3 ubiquitin-protein ligase listerin n=1 Tax=Cyclocybe aegerita TaxID=1973307 RepID=A0A8S0W3A1_CYCAE|nr:unnamed protein product [Cyclocybe aegerita]